MQRTGAPGPGTGGRLRDGRQRRRRVPPAPPRSGVPPAGTGAPASFGQPPPLPGASTGPDAAVPGSGAPEGIPLRGPPDTGARAGAGPGPAAPPGLQAAPVPRSPRSHRRPRLVALAVPGPGAGAVLHNRPSSRGGKPRPARGLQAATPYRRSPGGPLSPPPVTRHRHGPAGVAPQPLPSGAAPAHPRSPTRVLRPPPRLTLEEERLSVALPF